MALIAVHESFVAKELDETSPGGIAEKPGLF